MVYSTYRKLFGLFILTTACIAYALVSQCANLLFIPGVPLFQPPFGAPGNILLAILIGAALGLLLGWSESGVVSVLLASLLGAFFIAIATLLTGEDETVTQAQKVTAVAIIYVPTAGALAPVFMLFRWLISREVSAYRDASHYPSASQDTKNKLLSPCFQRFAWPAAILLICAALGLTSLYPKLARSVTPIMQVMIQQGLQSQTIQDLPVPLRPPDVKMFTTRARGTYTLQWDRDEHNQFAIPRPAGNFSEQSTVIARFEDGYLLACMFPSRMGQPTCRDF
jgi:hypothetical protein